MPRVQRLPPTPRKILALSLLGLAGLGATRAFFSRLLPATAPFNLPPQDLAVSLGSLACAAFFYWMARLRYGSAAVGNRPGFWGASLVVLTGLLAAAACLQWRRVLGDFDASSALPRLAGLAAAVCAAMAEEFSFRGSAFLALQELSPRRGSLWAVALGTLGFVALHAAYQGPWDLPYAAAAGLALGMARLRGASLSALVMAHAGMDALAVVWYSPTLTLGYRPYGEAAATALLTAALLALLPSPPTLPKASPEAAPA